MSFNVMLPICDTGYGTVSYNIWHNLYKKYKEVALFPIGGDVTLSENQNREEVIQSLKNSTVFHGEYPTLKVWHPNDLIIKVAGKSKYGTMSFFETDTLSQQERNSLSCCDVIFSPSQWAKDVMIANGIKNTIEICPLGVDLDIFDNVVPEDKLQDKYTFINIGKWETRKGHDLLVHIFNKAFTKEDNVELWMMNHNTFLSAEKQKAWENIYKSSPLGDKIRIFPRLSDQKSLGKAVAYAECGIYISRGEGWNNEVLENMAMNKPIITTNYSAHTQYCTPENSYLVEIQEQEKAQDGIWFFGTGNWAKLGCEQIDQTIAHMRYVYKNNIRTNPNGLETARKLQWQTTADTIAKILLS